MRRASSFSLSLFPYSFDREIHIGRRFEYSRPSYDQRSNGFIAGASLLAYPYVSLTLSASTIGIAHAEHVAARYQPFIQRRPPDARSTYPVLCVKRTSKQNLRLFRRNKNGRAREMRKLSFASGPRNFEQRQENIIQLLKIFLNLLINKCNYDSAGVYSIVALLISIYLSASEN